MKNIVEIRNDFPISDKRKKLWDIELNLLRWFQNVCEQEEIEYFFIGGSAIGVERHHGFIPWDDDIDIGMLRKDFEHFLSVYKKYRVNNVTVQYGLYEQMFVSFLRIRDELSTGIIKGQCGMDISHGVFIELYPFDFVPKNKLLRTIQWKLSAKCLRVLNHRYIGSRLTLAERCVNLFLKNKSNKQISEIWQSICTFYNGKCKKKVDTVSIPGYSASEVDYFDYEDVKETRFAEFEGMQVRVPVGNHNCLTRTYGDYMQLPPEESRGTHHNSEVFYDVDHPYTYYKGKEERLLQYFAGKTECV